MNAKVKGTHITRAQTIALGKRLEAVIINVDAEKGICEYVDGVDDQTIADEFGVSKNSVMGLRSEIYGKLFRIHKAAASESKQIEDLQRRCDKLQAQHADLLNLHNKLVDNLAVNRIVDVKHLKGMLL
jgi:hypothetical protein